MSARDFRRIAWELRQAYPEPGSTTATDLGSDWYAGQVRAWERCELAVERACRESNVRFDSDRFGMASSRIRRPDGSTWPMLPPR